LTLLARAGVALALALGATLLLIAQTRPAGAQTNGAIDIAEVVGSDLVVSTSGNGVFDDLVADNQEYYGRGDVSMGDAIRVIYQTVEFGAGFGPQERERRLGELCGNTSSWLSHIDGAEAVCPDDLGPLVDASGWVWLDVQFSQRYAPGQVGIAGIEFGRDVYDGPAFDPNTNNNKTFEVFRSGGESFLGTTTYDGGFSSVPSNSLLAVMRPQGASLLVSADAVASCTDPSLFVVGDAGFDAVDLSGASPGSVVIGGDAPTQQPTGGSGDSAIADLITGFLGENSNFKFADEERAAIQQVNPESYDNFEGPGVAPGVDVSAVAITEIFSGHVMFDGSTPGFADSLFASTFFLGSGDLVDPSDAPGFVLALNSITPDGQAALLDYATGRSPTLPPAADLFMPMTLSGDVPPDVLADLRGESDQLLSGASPQPSGWLVEPLFGSGGTLACGSHDGYEVLCDPTDPSGGQFSDGFGIYAMGIAGPLDAMGPPYVVEAPIVLLDLGTSNYVGSFEGDFFNGGNHAFVARSIDGGPPAFEHLAFDGSSWPAAPTNSRMVVSPVGTALIHDHGFHPSAVRFNTFKAGERRPGLVGSYSVPDMTQSPMTLDGSVNITPGLPGVSTFDLSTLLPEEILVVPDTPPTPNSNNDPVAEQPIVNDSPIAIPTPASDPSNPLWPWLFAATGLGLATTGTVIVRRNAGKLATAGSQVVITEEPPEPEMDASFAFGEAFMTAFGGRPVTIKEAGRPDHLSTAAWDSALHRETTIQATIRTEIDKLFNGFESTSGGAHHEAGVYDAFNDYLASLDSFQTQFVLLMSATTEFQGLLREWAEVQGIAAKQDLAFAVVQLAWGGFSLSKWLNAPAHVPWHRGLNGRMLASAPARTAANTGRAGTATAGGAKAADTLTDGARAGDAMTDGSAAVALVETPAQIASRIRGRIPNVPKMPGVHDTFIHGAEAGGFVLQNGSKVAVSSVARSVRNTAGYVEGTPVRLVSCHTASNGTASALASQLRTWVMAPTHRVWLDDAGNLFFKDPDAFWMIFDQTGTARFVMLEDGTRIALAVP
jgi:hypothetical protein